MFDANVSAILLVILATTCSVVPFTVIISPSFNSDVNLVPKPVTAVDEFESVTVPVSVTSSS